MSHDQLVVRRSAELVASGWTSVPNEILRDASLSMEARWLWGYLYSHSSTYLARFETIRQAAGCGRDKLQKIIRELESRGLLERVQEKTGEGGRFGVPQYRLYASRDTSISVPDSPVTASPVPASPVPDIQAPEPANVQVSSGDVFTGTGGSGGGEHGTPKKTNIKKDQTTLVAASATTPRKQGDPRGHRLPLDFQVTPDMVQWCLTTFPGLDGRAETEKFRDYWHSKAGTGARKVDWERTWKNWIRTAAERRPARSGFRTRVMTASNGAQIER